MTTGQTFQSQKAGLMRYYKTHCILHYIKKIAFRLESLWISVLVPARIGLTFAVARRGHGQDPEVILDHLTSLPGRGRESLPRRRALFWISAVAEGASGMSWLSVRIVCLFLVPSVTTVVALTVFLSHCCFHEIVLISTHDLYLLCLQFPSPALHAASRLEVWRVSVGALNQGVPFLNNQESAERKQRSSSSIS